MSDQADDMSWVMSRSIEGGTYPWRVIKRCSTDKRYDCKYSRNVNICSRECEHALSPFLRFELVSSKEDECNADHS